jgi:hypothetical protein
VASHTVKPGSKFFDVLGRVYDKMKARIQYYVSKDAIKKNERNIALEFEVWARIIKDSEGRDVQVFIKEDKKHGLRRDSSFYYDGSWKVLEMDETARVVKFTTSLGIKIASSYDRLWHLTNRTMTDKNNDTLASEQYIWKNARLTKITFNGVERNFIYGKTLQDTVKVIPSDEGLYFHSGYNNTAGRIPAEDEPEYSSFAVSPYSVYGMMANNTSPSQNRIFTLFRQTVSEEAKGMPSPEYIHPAFWQCTDINDICGKERGSSITYPYLESKCQDNGCGKYEVSYTIKPAYELEYIKLYQTYIKYDTLNVIASTSSPKEWRRYCVQQDELDLTYRHEVQHIRNGRNWAILLADKHMPKEPFSTKNECNTARQERRRVFDMEWMNWSIMEFWHFNLESPEQRPFNHSGYLCN